MRGRWIEQKAKFTAPAHPHPPQCTHWGTFPLGGGRFYKARNQGPRESAQRFPGERRGKGMKGGMPARVFRMEWTLPRRRRAPQIGRLIAAPTYENGVSVGADRIRPLDLVPGRPYPPPLPRPSPLRHRAQAFPSPPTSRAVIKFFLVPFSFKKKELKKKYPGCGGWGCGGRTPGA